MLTKIKKHYEKNGLVPRIKKSGGRSNIKHALVLDDVRNVTRFILNFAEDHAILLPGRIPGFKRDDVKVVPSNFTKIEVWRIYHSAAAPDQRVVGCSTFRKLWAQLTPYVVIAKPASDLCWTCQKNNNLIAKCVNVDEESKSAVLKKQEQHLHLAMIECSFYQAKCRDAKATAATHGISKLESAEPNSKDIHFNYSFDYAQQVHYPADPQQPGPIYYKTPRKCQVFGIHAEGIPSQINYLIDEAVFCGKGANVVISLLHHFLGNYGIGEMHLNLNTDNCSGQNKNNCMVWYLCWRCLVDLHTTIHIHFMLPGHTKFAPDWCFGLFKRLFKRTFVSSLAELQDVVDRSTERGINNTQLVGDQHGNVLVPTYDWTTFPADFFRRFPGIKSQQHFFFSAKEPGMMKYKSKSDDDWESITLKKVDEIPAGMPQLINPKGMDLARKSYLYKEIRDFCKDETKDLVCPKPLEMIPEEEEDAAAITTVKTATEQTLNKRGRGGTGRRRVQ